MSKVPPPKSNIITFSSTFLDPSLIDDTLSEIELIEEIRDSFKEIMIDEYQDTNDIQDAFISLIANNNVYMVGDIKQSIYRFRNANPYILWKNMITMQKK